MQPKRKWTDAEYLNLQASHAITRNHAEIAAYVGCHPSKIRQYASGHYHIPAHRLFHISAAQDDFTYAQMLAEDGGAVVLPQRLPLVVARGVRMLTALVRGFSRIVSLAEKIDHDKPLNDKEIRDLEREGEDLKTAIDDLLRKAHLERALEKKKNPPQGDGHDKE